VKQKRDADGWVLEDGSVPGTTLPQLGYYCKLNVISRETVHDRDMAHP